MKAADSLPDLQTFQLLPMKTARTAILDVLEWEPRMRRESCLLEALQMQTARLALAKGQTIVLQGQAVLQQLYAKACQNSACSKRGKGRKGKALEGWLTSLAYRRGVFPARCPT
ncbi:hypothetical protein BT96DRAFT_1050398 [Gymnopus androsaceus JB14]|uniref:Uncharacterized protein n=1 Tax=Gymnopus androsaceus JB14 TaxID=1447944 RepID=A0A6A4H7L5_9AGAR|nr:hypothetical protein BT96DRAFT_1050398 [Gymnopus androsaceus JB14]